MSAPKVLLLAHEHLYGGGTRQTYLIAEALVAAGVETLLISNAEKTWLGQTIQQSGLPIKTYYSPHIERAIRPLQELQVLWFLLTVFWTEKPDVILASGVKLIGLSGIAGWLCGVPHRVAIIRGEGAPPGSKTLKAIYAMHRFMALIGMRFITVSEYIRQQMLAGRLCRPSQIQTVHDGVPVEDFRAQVEARRRQDTLFYTDTYGLPPGAFKIGMVGRFVAGKRYDQFIQLMADLCQEHEHVYGFLIGDGPDREGLEAQIEASGYASRIHLAGYCPDMSNAYADLDVTVLLTDYEGCPNAVLESMAVGVPVLASDVCGIGEIIDSGKNGFLVPPGDLESAAQFLRQVIDTPQQLKALGESASQTIAERFNASSQLQLLIQSLLSPPTL